MELNTERTGKDLKFFELSKKIVESCGYELYDMSYISGSSTLRVFIMDPKTKSAVIEDCVKVDREFTPYCETEEWIPEDFVLEVSSPGVYRELRNPRHFELSQGEMISCKLVMPLVSDELAGQLQVLNYKTTQSLRGKLVSCSQEGIEIEVGEKKLFLAYSRLKKVNLDPDI